MISLSNKRIKIESIGNELKIIIKAERDISIYFLGIWLIGWLIGEIIGIIGLIFIIYPLLRDLFIHETNKKIGEIVSFGIQSPDAIIFFFWVIGWTIGGLFFFAVLIWKISGRQIITLDSNTLIIEKKAFNFKIGKTYSRANIKDVRLNTLPTLSNPIGQLLGKTEHTGFYGWGMEGCRIAFDYGMKTVNFASEIEKEDAIYFLGLFKQKGLPVQKVMTHGY